MARYNTNGTLDTSFGNGGLVIITGNSSGPAFGIAVQSDGKIVTAAPGNLDLDIFRFNPNGSPDSTFGSSGVVESEGGFFVGATTGGVVLHSDGKIVVAAGTILVRLLTNGQSDSTFGSGGVATLLSFAQSLALLPSGKFLVSSAFPFTVGAVTRYNANGRLDTTFGINGQAPGVGIPSALVVLSTGKFIVAGTLDSSVQTSGITQGFSLLRNNSNGSIDTGFGTLGGVVTPFPGNVFAAAHAVAVQSNGNIVAAGQTSLTNPVSSPGPSDFALARYTAAGQLDTTFGTGGFVTTAFGSSVASVAALAIQTDGKIVAVGNSSGGITIARYLAQ